MIISALFTNSVFNSPYAKAREEDSNIHKNGGLSMKLKTLLTTILVICTTALISQIIHIPADQPTIQAGIDVATNGDTILVAEGTYYENIRFLGKAITVASEFLMDGDESHIENTIIDGSQATHPDTSAAVMFIDNEDTASLIAGFTITGGSGIHDFMYDVQFGGGIAVMNAGAKIENNILTQNNLNDDWAAGGCGIGAIAYLGDTWLVVRNNTIVDNHATCENLSAFGGGMNSTMNSIIENNVIEYNTCENITGTQADGAGIEIEQLPGSLPIFADIGHNEVRYNTLTVGNVAIGAGIIIYGASSSIHDNNISFNEVIANSYGNGAGIYIQNNAGEIEIRNNDIKENKIISEEWARGGGIALWQPPNKVNIIGNTIEGNTIVGYDNRGSGIWIRYPGGNMNITGNLIKDNTGPKTSINSAAGGGICIMDASGEVRIDKNIFKGNEIYNGGGLYFRNSLSTVVTNNVFDGNKSLYGGGISYFNPSDKSYGLSAITQPWPVFANNTLVNNEAQIFGGGLYYYTNLVTPILFNSIVRDNTAGTGNDIYSLTGAEYLVEYCNINTDDLIGNWMGGNNINASPAFIDDSCHLAPYCICVEAGTPSVSYNGIEYNCPDHDIDGELRPLNGTADIGVDEVLLTGIFESGFCSKKHQLVSYPNPFIDQTTIEFTLNAPGLATLTISDVRGKILQTLLSENLPQGKHQINWDAKGLDDGIYFIKLNTNNETTTHKVIHLNVE